MKLIIALLTAAVVSLAIAYASLYLDNNRLQDELTLLRKNPSVLTDASPQGGANTYTHTQPISPKSAGVIASLTSPAVIALDSAQEENLTRILEQKYAILFSVLKISRLDQEQLRALLMARERILSGASTGEASANIESQQTLVAQIDKKIAELLKPDDVKKYELLKDSNYEQQQINSFYDELATKKALSEDNRNTLMLSKLEQRNARAMLLETSAEEINNASPADKKALAERFKESLTAYNDNYLRVAKENLSDEQFAVLRDNEKKQFEDVWQDVIAGWQSN